MTVLLGMINHWPEFVNASKTIHRTGFRIKWNLQTVKRNSNTINNKSITSGQKSCFDCFGKCWHRKDKVKTTGIGIRLEIGYNLLIPVILYRWEKNIGIYYNESIGKPIWDYRWAGMYYVTISTGKRALYFGDIVDKEMILSKNRDDCLYILVSYSGTFWIYTSGYLSNHAWSYLWIDRNCMQHPYRIRIPNCLHFISPLWCSGTTGLIFIKNHWFSLSIVS